MHDKHRYYNSKNIYGEFNSIPTLHNLRHSILIHTVVLVGLLLIVEHCYPRYL